ncbi:MAG: hypothetical protein JST00_19860 [Deltaproteobacteria bacterium]|nr:hypothetical protein [Deltaproteobacteria bacterium]
MTDERESTDRSPGEGAQGESADEGEERPTVAPPFDPIAFAQEVLGGKPSPPAGTPAQRRASVAPKGASAAPKARPTPTGLMSLANQRVPSNLPPPRDPPPPREPPPRKESIGALGAVDREWVELATRPPPPAFEEAIDRESRKTKPPVGLATPPALSLDLDDDLATRPPPPMQQQLIDAIARGDAPPSTKEAPDLTSAMAQAALRSVPVPAGVPEPPAAPTAQEMNDRVALGDYSGALEIAERLLAVDPNDPAVNACAESCRSVLKKMYTARIGPLDRVPMVMVARDQLRWLSIDHRAGFVLSLVDGVSSLEMILDVSGMPELDALRILSELAQERIISFR